MNNLVRAGILEENAILITNNLIVVNELDKNYKSVLKWNIKISY